jgi:FkbM family methyltransferase
MNIKSLLKYILNFIHLDLTKNLEYDRQTKLIMRRVINNNSNCIDVGCHKGEILESILKYSHRGKHYAFEPIPYLFNQLERKYKNKALIYPYALSDKAGESSFQFVKNAPAYSGIKKRKYDIVKPDIEEIKVELRTLDEIIPGDIKIDFIKIDVEGGEYGVLKGAKKLLKSSQPIVVFECGMGASDYYGTNPIELYKFITEEVGLKVSTLKSYIKNNKPLTLNDFDYCFKTNKEYYFIAHK